MLPDALDLLPELRAARDRAGRLLVGLDFDGTLAPIVPHPDDAALPAALKPLLEALAARPDTDVALISGRGLHDLAARVAIPGIYYAGNHGLEIDGPDVHRVHEAATAARDRLAAIAGRIEIELRDVPGVIVENKGLTLSVHYRMVDPDAAPRVRTAAHAAADVPGIRSSDGRMIVEIRPDADWHKGRALRFLYEALDRDATGIPVVFVGDDRTDEDAFREIRDDGWGIIVGDATPDGTAACAALASTHDVARFVQGLALDGPRA